MYGEFLETSDYQFGFKKNIGCTHAIFAVSKLINSSVMCGDTANIAALDIAKAFPRVNHSALLIKLYKRNVPVSFIDLLANWLPRSVSAIKWKNCISDSFPLRTGVNQGSACACTSTFCCSYWIRH